MHPNAVLCQLFCQIVVENPDYFLGVAGFQWVVCLEAGSPVAQAGLKFSMSLKMTLSPTPLAFTSQMLEL